MDETKKKELFPYFAYLYSQQMNPEKYGQIESMEEWIKTIQESEDDTQQIIQAAEQLTDEDWENLDEQYSQQKEANNAILAAKGAKLKKLKSKAKKCKCGCDMVTVKEKGGKMISKCSCGCGGDIKKGAKGIVAPKPTIATGSVNRPVAPIMDEIDIMFARHENEQVAQANKQIGETFSQRFARERASGAKEFTFNGKRYTTQLASEVTPKPVNQPTVPVTKAPAVPNNVPGSTQATQEAKAAAVAKAATLAKAAKAAKESTQPSVPVTQSKPVQRPLPKWKIYYDNFNWTPRNILPKFMLNSTRFVNWNKFLKEGGLISKSKGILKSDGKTPVKPEFKSKNIIKEKEVAVDTGVERNSAKKANSEFYSKNGYKYDTQSGLPIMRMNSVMKNTEKKQSGGDINQQIGSTKKGGKTKNRLSEKAVTLKKGKKLKPKTKK